ncbi:hypothetical protein ACQSSU_06775 [Micromonospora echinospora]
MRGLLAYLAVAILGLAAGWEAHHLRTRGLVLRLHAACTGIGDRRHLADVIAGYARLLHVRIRRTR